MTKFYLYTFITFLTFGCVEQSEKKNGPVDKDNQRDTSSIISSLNAVDSNIEISTEIVLNDTIINQINEVTPWQYQNGNLKVNDIVKLDRNIFYVLYEIADGVSLTSYLMTFLNNNHINYEVLEQHVDADLSMSHYEYSELRESKANKFKKVHFTQVPTDSNTFDSQSGWFKDGYTMDNVDLKTDSIVIWIKINNAGIITRDTIK
jgi:hypothetical protein